MPTRRETWLFFETVVERLPGSGPLLPPYCLPSASIVNRPGGYGAGKSARTPPRHPVAPAGARPLPASLRFRLASFGPQYPSRRTCSSDATPAPEVVLRCFCSASVGDSFTDASHCRLTKRQTRCCSTIVLGICPRV